MNATTRTRNPGPSWGYRCVSLADRLFPNIVMDRLLDAGSFCALLMMKRQRAHSRKFLTEALNRPATLNDCWRRFSAFAQLLIQRFRAADGYEPVFEVSDRADDRMESLANAKEQALYGTFHFGNSDLMGFWLSRFEITLRMVREKVGNSDDLHWLEKRFGDRVAFIFVNDPSEMLFALKKAIDEGHSVAMKCDRVEHSSKREAFEFMGKKRLFPFTIYHLAILFQLPVAFALGVPRTSSETVVHSSTVYRPTAGDKKESLRAARAHFQDTLRLLECRLKENPYLWFNFLSENPVVPNTK